MRNSAILFAMVFALTSFRAWAEVASKEEQAAIVAVAEKAGIEALTFRQGDPASLARARVHFTPDGWTDFMKHMAGFVDEKGAPTFSSSFVASRNATVLGEKDGVVHFRIPGTLTQSSNLGKTTYRAAIEVYALRDLMIHRGEPIKIQHLEQLTCAGASSDCK